MEAITTMFTTLQTSLLSLVLPTAVIALVLWFLMNALAPVIPDWAQAARGHLQRVLLGVVVVGFATTIVTALYGLGGAGGAVGGG
ncbi:MULTISPECIES: hypothetical protein [Candidatus Chloroploca]|uniref:Uncharacterized protein n=1 Tax=Candidatus Chloroploca asiatica TaxID=1506545 RepID=A0A2H3KL64_9CHLR|nr:MULTISPECIES: hypothetical protein [Candidatus Chloroploca]NCC32041.1 hypothetical protein [Chloroflexia bacterium]PDV97998.1 hypothetical protein A9Q02_16530 [Candidatus Chloroploca asiatica]